MKSIEINNNQIAYHEFGKGDTTLLFIYGTCHFPMIENPDTFNRILQKIIKTIIS